MHREVKHKQNNVITEKMFTSEKVFDLATKLFIVFQYSE